MLDFIDMERHAHREKVFKALLQALKEDKAKTTAIRISELGLVEMTRKNVARSLLENFSEPCPHCDGRGVLLKEDEALRAGPPAPAELAANEATG